MARDSQMEKSPSTRVGTQCCGFSLGGEEWVREATTNVSGVKSNHASTLTGLVYFIRLYKLGEEGLEVFKACFVEGGTGSFFAKF